MIATVDVVLFRINNATLELLLYRRKADSEVFPGIFTLPGGYVFEDIDACMTETVQRLISLKVGVKPAYIEQVCTVGNRDRDPRGWSLTVLHLALVPYSQSSLCSDERHWVNARQFLDATTNPLPFDHNYLVSLALERLSSKSRYTSLPLYLAEQRSSLPELQRIYEEVLDNKLHKKAFRDRLLAAELLIDTGERFHGRGSPTVIYQIKQHGIATFERLMQGHKTE